MRALLAALLAVAVGSFVASCSVVKAPERPNWRVFALEPTGGAAARSAADAEGPVVVVASPESGAGYSTRRMAYTHGGGELEYFAEHRWADTPSRMLLPLFRDALERTGAFAAVATTPTRAQADVVVESKVLAFRQEIEAESAVFRAVLRITVVGSGPEGSTRAKTFEVEEPLEVSGPAEGVVAANRAVDRLLAEAADFCVQATAP